MTGTGENHVTGAAPAGQGTWTAKGGRRNSPTQLYPIPRKVTPISHLGARDGGSPIESWTTEPRWSPPNKNNGKQFLSMFSLKFHDTL